MLKKVLAMFMGSSLWTSGENICVQLGSLETDSLVGSEAEEESDCGVVAPEDLLVQNKHNESSVSLVLANL